MQMDALSFKKMDLTEFCAAAISVHQLEGNDQWEQHARAAYEIFEKEGNRVISVDELARVRPFHPSRSSFKFYLPYWFLFTVIQRLESPAVICSCQIICGLCYLCSLRCLLCVVMVSFSNVSGGRTSADGTDTGVSRMGETL